MNKYMLYDVKDKLPFGKNMLFALQQVLSIIVATMLLPMVADPSGEVLSQSAALIGAGVGTLVYLALTGFKSPVFLGSSFSFVAPITSAVAFGYMGVFLGTLFAGLVYVLLSILIRFVGTNWINKIMPPIVIGPVVALIGLNLSTSAISDITHAGNGEYNLISILIGLITFFVVILVSTKGKKLRMYPFIIGILIGYASACLFTLIGIWTNVKYLQIVDFSVFKKIADFGNWLPKTTIVGMIEQGFSKITSFTSVISIFVAFVPISLVSFAEHIADHKNLGSIIGHDLIKDPGLKRTLLGDGLGSIAGAVIGGCPNTTYGESIGCVALSKNASTKTIATASILCILIAFCYPIIAFVESIPSCVIGGICIALYGLICVSGLRMFSDIDLNESKNLFVVAAIFICGIGGLVINFGQVQIYNIACALIVGILSNVLLRDKKQSPKISQDNKLLESKQTITTKEEKEIKKD